VVRITHPAHPLRGQSFPAKRRGREPNSQLFEIQRPDGEIQLIPLDWTDQAPPTVTLPGARFLLSNLLSLRQRLDALLPGATKANTIPSMNDTQIIGGNCGANPNSAPVVESIRKPTDADDCAAGADAFASDKPGTEGGAS
jgi:hypothetical protein